MSTQSVTPFNKYLCVGTLCVHAAIEIPINRGEVPNWWLGRKEGRKEGEGELGPWLSELDAPHVVPGWRELARDRLVVLGWIISGGSSGGSIPWGSK
jgi:hypothetical protein